MLEWQILLHPRQMKWLLVFGLWFAASWLCFLLVLRSSLSLTLLASDVLIPVRVIERQYVLLLVICSRFSVGTWKDLRSCLQMSFYLSFGRPLELVPDDNCPYKMSFGMRPSSIRHTCPSHCNPLCLRIVYMLGMLARDKTSSFVTRSCQVIPNNLLRQRMWNVFSLRSWLAYSVQASLP